MVICGVKSTLIVWKNSLSFRFLMPQQNPSMIPINNKLATHIIFSINQCKYPFVVFLFECPSNPAICSSVNDSASRFAKSPLSSLA
jgi:hypothetical protein